MGGDVELDDPGPLQPNFMTLEICGGDWLVRP